MSHAFYIIHHHSEECTCSNCGSPLYVGDRVYTLQGEDLTFCCPDCIAELQAYMSLVTIHLLAE